MRGADRGMYPDNRSTLSSSPSIAGQHMRSNQVRSFVVADERHIEIFVRISQIGDGRFGGRLAISGYRWMKWPTRNICRAAGEPDGDYEKISSAWVPHRTSGTMTCAGGGLNLRRRHVAMVQEPKVRRTTLTSDSPPSMARAWDAAAP